MKTYDNPLVPGWYTSPGWYAFEGARFEVKYEECEEGEHDIEEWDESEGEYVYFKKFDSQGKHYRTVYEVRYSTFGEQVNTRNSFGPHRGEPILCYLDCISYIKCCHSVDLLIGEWTKLDMPWDRQDKIVPPLLD